MTAVNPRKLKQRVDYTYKYNAKTGRHGWLRLTPAYSVKIVEELIGLYDCPKLVLDPFCGTATTALSAAYHGHEGITTDINPFLVWFGGVKTARYDTETLASTRRVGSQVAQLVRENGIGLTSAPPIHNIERWWSAESLTFLRTLKAAIERESESGSPERDLLLVAFCRSLIRLSNAAFNHQSMSFKDDRQLRIPLDADMAAVFSDGLQFVLDGARENPKGKGEVLLGDARRLDNAIEGPCDLVITSPPYANRMSYIRELRPYMYWLGFLDDAGDAGELDWEAIGGTWGKATSRLADWKCPRDTFTHPLLDAPLNEIADQSNRNGGLLATYVAKYFDDMWRHFRSLVTVLTKGSDIHYIVGNSTFYGVLLPVEQIYRSMLSELGFHRVECRAIRKRNSKKELFEFDVSARWIG